MQGSYQHLDLGKRYIIPPIFFIFLSDGIKKETRIGRKLSIKQKD